MPLSGYVRLVTKDQLGVTRSGHGSAFLDAEGKALGTLSTLALAPLPAPNGVGDLASELSYAQQHSGIAGLELVPGTEPFSPAL